MYVCTILYSQMYLNVIHFVSFASWKFIGMFIVNLLNTASSIEETEMGANSPNDLLLEPRNPCK